MELSQRDKQRLATGALFSALVKHHAPQSEQPLLPSWTAQAAKLWRAGKNTKEIADALSLKEHEIANRLPAIRSWCRQLRGGGGAI